MANYYSKSEIGVWERQQEGYQDMVKTWQEHVNMLEEEGITELPLKPEQPMKILSVFESRIADQMEEIETAVGTIIVLPGRVVLTGPDGQSFSLSSKELELQYTLAEFDD